MDMDIVHQYNHENCCYRQQEPKNYKSIVNNRVSKANLCHLRGDRRGLDTEQLHLLLHLRLRLGAQVVRHHLVVEGQDTALRGFLGLMQRLRYKGTWIKSEHANCWGIPVLYNIC